MKYALTTLLLLALALPAWAEDLPLEDPSDPVAVIKTSMGDVYVELFVKEAPKTVESFLGLAEGTKEWTDPSTGQKVRRPFYDGLTFHRVISGFMCQGGCPLGNGSGGPGYTFDDELDAKGLGLDKIKAFTNGRPHKWLAVSVRSQRDFQIKIVRPLCDLMGITNDDELKAREKEVRDRIAKMTLQEAYELLGYEYAEGRSKHKPVRGALAMANSGPNTNGSQFFINLDDTDWLTGKHTVFGRVVKGMEVVDKIGATPVNAEKKPLTPVKILSIRRMK